MAGTCALPRCPPSPDARRHRLLRTVLPLAVVLVALLLLAFVQIMLLWSEQ
ncbi:hypothetical protein [Hymenobacter glacialis]|uniref:hypothetical protein n=1 Tax=Hymenobacter glacialis TaxID=1908236 RepID=UPI000AE04638|nr:hypothetical protein [Hymenobacter glacialis]